jgi:hypothetical protein
MQVAEVAAQMKGQLVQEDRLADLADLEAAVVEQIGPMIEQGNLELLTLAVVAVVEDRLHLASILEYL